MGDSLENIMSDTISRLWELELYRNHEIKGNHVLIRFFDAEGTFLLNIKVTVEAFEQNYKKYFSEDRLS